jgi:gas vesicle protein GvpL/GvpF
VTKTRVGNLTPTETVDDRALGWYLYGISRRGTLASVLAAASDDAYTGSDPATRDGAPLELLEFSALAAVVRPVPLADFNVAALRDRLRDASALEAMVRSHNRVIESIHARQAILPAKFGVVYTDAEDVVSALEPTQDALLQQLDRLEGCDEWAVHLYAKPGVVRQRVAAEDSAIQRLRDEHAAARPGRAYFLEQQIRDQLETATELAFLTLAQNAFDRLASQAVAGQVNPLGAVAERTDEVEILRASFLVSREGSERFTAEAFSSTQGGDGLRCEYSGPWPPYSFAAQDAEVAE